jgi:hypothetical protein
VQAEPAHGRDGPVPNLQPFELEDGRHGARFLTVPGTVKSLLGAGI